MKYFLAILLLSTLVSCRPTTKQEDKSKYFEGFVEFKVSYTTLDDKYMAHMMQGFGVRIITYLGKNGFFSREYIDSNNIIVGRNIYRPDSLKFYDIPSRGNIVYSTDVTRATGSDVFMGIIKNSSYKILNHRVDAIQSKSAMQDFRNVETFYVYTTYYNDVNYPIDPLTYERAKFDDVEELFSHSPYLTTGTYFRYANRGSVAYIATRIVPTHVDSFHFEIPKNKVIIEQ